MNSNARKSVSALKHALLAKRLRADSEDFRFMQSEPIAVVGMACRTPGDADTPEALWELLASGRDAISEIPAERWSRDAWYDPDPATPGKINTRFGGFLRGIDGFDPAAFGISPKEARYMDPQQRLLLETAWEAADDGGKPLDTLRGSATGVFFGLSNSDYGRMQLEHPDSISAYTVSGTAASIAAGRLSYLFDLRGPSVVIDTACSSALVAVHLAIQSLRNGECDAAFAGGVNLNLAPEETISLAKWGMLAPDGRCKTFDARANGFVRSEGCGAIVLMRLADAVRDGCRIQAVIRGSAVNQDGRSNVLTAPNGEAQRAVIRTALRQSGVAASDVSYVETHGTGTKVGDPIEVEALLDVYGASRPTDNVCYLGAIKANLGHLEAAAGIAGLIKVVLCLRHRTIPSQIHFRSLNPLLSLADTALRIPTSLTSWNTGGKPRIAAVSSFGFSGTNAHLLLEEPPVLPLVEDESHAQPIYLLPVSARHAAGVRELAAQYAKRLDGQRENADELRDICFTASRRRSHWPYRQALAGDSKTLLQRLAAMPGLPLPQARLDEPKLGFVYSGQGCNWFGMARGLLREQGVFAATVDACDATLRPLAGWSIREQLEAPADTCRLHRTDHFQPTLFAIQAGLTAQLGAWGIRPFAVAGHSVGEIAAAQAAGILSLEDAVKLVQTRGRLMQQASGKGAMAAVALSIDALRQRIGDNAALSVAAANGPDASTVSGEPAALEALLAGLRGEGIFCRELEVECAFHSAHMDPYVAPLKSALSGFQYLPARTLFVSSVTGEPAGGSTSLIDAAYWGRNLREPVLFHAAIAQMLHQGCTAFIEIGPHPVLSAYVLETASAAGKTCPVLPTMRRDQDDRGVLLEAVASLYAHGCDPDWAKLAPQGRVVSLPPYPWQRESYWLPEEEQAPTPVRRAEKVHPLLGWRVDSPFAGSDVFENILTASDPAYLTDHRIGGACLVPATAMIEAMLQAARKPGAPCCRLEHFTIDEPLSLLEHAEVPVQTGMAADTAGATVRLYSRDGQTGGNWLLHASSRVASQAAAAKSKPSLDELQQSCGERISVDDYYTKGKSAGLEFGPAFQSLAEARAGNDRACGRIELYGSAAANAAQYLLHPVILDGALQLIDVAYRERTDDGRLLLPIGIDAIDVYAPLHEEAFAVATLCDEATSARSVVRADVDLFAMSGELRASLSGVQLKATDVQALARSLRPTGEAAREDDRWTYRLRWDEETAARPLAEDMRRAPLLIVAESLEAGTAIAEQAQGTHGYPGTYIIYESAREARADKRHCAVDFTEAAAIRTAVEAAVTALPDAPSIDVVLCAGLTARNAEPPATRPTGDLSERQRATAGALHVLQALAGMAADARVFLVTRGAQDPAHEDGDCDPAQTALWGLGSTVQVEHPEFGCRMIDLDPDSDWVSQLQPLFDEMSRDAAGGDRVALRDTRRYVCRLEATVRDHRSENAKDDRRIQLEAPGNGLLDDLVFADAARRKPAAHEIEIETRALGINFRDVLNALGEVEGPTGAALGAECAGTVLTVGEDVHDFEPGDAVMAFTLGGMSTHVTVPAALVARIPRGLDFAEAATCPVAFLTAKYALEQVTSLRQGETILIHAAAGGVGLAAVQVALRAGARVIATAGSPEKRAYLHGLGLADVLDSRDPAFADGVREVTNGGGVDVVLNSLAGDFIPAGLALLAEGGRFVELGKRDDWDQEKVSATWPGVSHTRFDLGTIATAEPELIRAMQEELVADLARGDLRPLPYRAYPIERAAQAFRRMAQGRHLGKLVLTRVPGGQEYSIARADASYLITGGLGALGLSVAERLATLGATSLVLIGRSAGSGEAEARVQKLRDNGTDVRILQADVANFESLKNVFDEIAATLPPLKGVVHCAGLLADAAFTRQTWPGFLAVMEPKVAGTWNLHELSRTLDLDYFVLFSSAAAVIGWPGQANYAAANAAMDGIAHYRRARGLPASSINWGAWGRVGMVQNVRDERGDPFAEHGLVPHEPEEGIDTFVKLTEAAASDFLVGHFDWERFARRYPPTGVPEVFNRVCGARPAAQKSGPSPAAQHRLLDELRATPALQQRRVLDRFLVEQAAATLGLSAATAVNRKLALNEQGLDSLLAVEMRNAIAQALGCSLPASLLFDYPSINALGRHLLDDVLPGIGIAPASVDSTPLAPERDALETDIENLSDDEAEALLSQELGLTEDRELKQAAD